MRRRIDTTVMFLFRVFFGGKPGALPRAAARGCGS
jgi:hypothetical protein